MSRVLLLLACASALGAPRRPFVDFNGTLLLDLQKSRFSDIAGAALAIAHTLVHTMRKYKDEWQADLEERGRQELAQLQAMGEGQQGK